MKREDQSDFLDSLTVSKRGIVKTAASQVPNGRVEVLSQEDVTKALRAFDKCPDVSKDVLSKFKERAKIDLSPKTVVEDFFQEFCASRRELQQLSIITALTLRQNGIFKFSGRDVYEDLETGDFWKISDDKKHVMRLFKEDESGVSDKKASVEAAKTQRYIIMESTPGDGGVVQATSFDEVRLESKQAGKKKGPGIPDGTGPMKDSPECPYNKDDEEDFDKESDILSSAIKSAANYDLGSGGVVMSIKLTKDGQGFEIKIDGSFRSGDSLEDTVKQIKDFWNKLDIDS